MNYFGKTDIGRKREKNEDNFEIYEIADNAILLLVCDGMGGHDGGEIASESALSSFINEINIQTDGKLDRGKLVLDDAEADVPMMLENALSAANFEVWQRAHGDVSLRGMGTTLVGAFVMSDPLAAWSVNLGDSRLYRIRNEEMLQMTKDHSYVQFLVDSGKITAHEAEKRTDRNIITKAVGISVQAEPDIEKLDVREDDILVLCSDGLSGMLSADEICGISDKRDSSLQSRVNSLVSLANDAGGDDNITVIIAEL